MTHEQTNTNRYGKHGGRVPHGANANFYHARFDSDIAVRHADGTTETVQAFANVPPVYRYELIDYTEHDNGTIFSNRFTFSKALASEWAETLHEVRVYSECGDTCYKIINPKRSTRRMLANAKHPQYEYI